jgi:hypothetical protein
MPPDQLGADVMENVLHGEFPGLLGYRGLKHDMQKEIAEFSPEMIDSTTVERVNDLVGLFDQAVAQGTMGLFAVPGALSAKSSDHLDESAEIGSGNRGERSGHTGLGVVADEHSKLSREAQLERAPASRPLSCGDFLAIKGEV